MRSLRKIALLTIVLVSTLFAQADDVITNVISPIVSYQYFESPGDALLNLQSSPTVSYFWHSGNSFGQVVVHGRVTDANGIPLTGATLAAMVYLSPVAQATTDRNGVYQMPLGAGVYAIAASAPGYAKSSRVLTLSVGSATQNFQLVALPATPKQTPVSRQPATFAFPPIGSLGEHLKAFNGTAFVDITPVNTPSPAKMTVVLTHGWNPQALGYEVPNAGVEGWPTTTAAAIEGS